MAQQWCGTVFYSGISTADENHRHDVGILLDEKLRKTVGNFVPLSEMVIIFQFFGKQIDINIIQVCDPMADISDNYVEDFYGQLDQPRKLT